MRDWLSTLWPASFRGIPFFVQSDNERGGRRLAVHQFPGRDAPFVEDLGEDQRGFQVTAYLVGDTSDSDSSSFASNLARAGSGPLVLPVQGSITARVREFSRERSLDRLGYIAFKIQFVREGFATPLASALQLAQLVFDGVDSLVSTMGTLATAGLVVRNQPGWIVSDTVAAVQDISASVETVRAVAVIDPETSRTIKNRLVENFNGVPAAAVVPGGFAATVMDAASIARDLGAAMGPVAAAPAFRAAIDDVVTPTVPEIATVNAQVGVKNTIQAARLSRLVLMAPYVEAVVSREYESRPDGVAARTQMADVIATELGACRGAPDAELNVVLQDLRARAVDHISAAIADLRPVVTVAANEPMPSLWWAWRLYQDPTRASELVARNKIKHPAWMPERFSALAPHSP
jgi:prophage DNA circulation protein